MDNAAQTAEQRSAAWHAERAGKWTGSRFVDVLARNKKTGEPLKCYWDLIWQVACERLTGQPIEGPNGFALQWGSEVEGYAKEALEIETGLAIEDAPFIAHPDHSFVGASPDGLIGGDGGCEIKCPRSSIVHLERFLSGTPEEYVPQVQGCMWVTGRKWWIFASYDPRMPESHRLLTIKIQRDDAYIAKLEAAVLAAEEEVHKLLEKLRAAA